MSKLKKVFRLFYINHVLVKHGLDDLTNKVPLFQPFKIFRKDLKNIPRGQRLREAFEELGPIFVKFGQLLSTRVDLLPEDISTEIAKLQDSVTPFNGELAKDIVEKSLGKPITEIFLEFELKPLASASIAQVHAAKLLDGKDVVVKILRPNIEFEVKRDIDLLLSLAQLIEKYWKRSRRFRPVEIVKEIQKSIYGELDLMRDAANASQLRRNFTNSHLLYVPEVFWDETRKNILTMERIYGVPVSDMQQLKAQNTNLKLLAERGVEIFFTQVFNHCFFHADMHPGNVWVSKEHPQNPRYLALDFGIMGTLGPEDQRYLAGNFLAFFNRDYRRVAELHVESGWVPKTTRVDEFESAIRSVCEPIFDKPLKDISFGKTLLRLLQVARRFDMEVQPQLILLQKTLISVEGLGRQLYPELDLWNTAKPFLEDWMKRRLGPKAILKKIRYQGPYFIDKINELIQTKIESKANVPPENVRNNNNIIRSCGIFLIGGLIGATIFSPTIKQIIINNSQVIAITSLITIGISMVTRNAN